MKIDLSEALTNDNRTSEYEIVLEAADINVNGTKCKVVSAPSIVLTVTNQAGVRLDMKADGEVKLSAPCDRCLEPVEIAVEINIDEQIQVENSGLTGEIPDFVEGNSLDVEAAIMDCIYSNYPGKVLCDEECKGLCLKCGQNLNIKECGCDRFVQDPRMAAFNDLFL